MKQFLSSCRHLACIHVQVMCWRLQSACFSRNYSWSFIFFLCSIKALCFFWAVKWAEELTHPLPYYWGMGFLKGFKGVDCEGGSDCCSVSIVLIRNSTDDVSEIISKNGALFFRWKCLFIKEMNFVFSGMWALGLVELLGWLVVHQIRNTLKSSPESTK